MLNVVSNRGAKLEMEIEKEVFKKLFPRLAKELKLGEEGIEINSVRRDLKTGEEASSGKFAGYTPDVIDFIRRCDNEQQAEKIINYLEKQEKISHDYAEKLKKQVREKGVRSFGSKKEDGYYLKQRKL